MAEKYKNILDIFVTFEVFQLLKSKLNVSIFLPEEENILDIVETLEVFQLLIFPRL